MSRDARYVHRHAYLDEKYPVPRTVTIFDEHGFKGVTSDTTASGPTAPGATAGSRQHQDGGEFGAPTNLLAGLGDIFGPNGRWIELGMPTAGDH